MAGVFHNEKLLDHILINGQPRWTIDVSDIEAATVVAAVTVEVQERLTSQIVCSTPKTFSTKREKNS